MINCGVFTGILFSRKPCDYNAIVHCGQCNIPLCKFHMRSQLIGPFLCPDCYAYSNDDSWRYSRDDNRWEHRPGPAPSTPSMQTGTHRPDPGLSDEDKAGFSTSAHASDAADQDQGEDSSGFAESDFDAS